MISIAVSSDISPTSWNFVLSSLSISIRDFELPSASVMEIPSSSIACAAAFGGSARRVRTLRSVVPACDPLIPALAITPRATATSSAEYPSDPASGATYLKDSPRVLTFVLELDAAAARMSTKSPVSSADIPNAVRASVTISDTVARFSPEAAARFITPSMPAIICSLFHPAIAMYSMASPASTAEYFVVAPISRAFSRKASNSVCVAPEIALTLDICESNSEVVLITAAPRAATAAVTGRNFSPTDVMELPISCSFLPFSAISCNPDPDSLACFSRFFRLFSVAMISR